MNPTVEVRPAEAEWLVREWHAYLQRFVQEDGRVMDPQRASLTTSEGQTYAMIRAVWIGDQPSFERILTWTVNNLQGGDPSRLPAWKWGKAEDGSWKVLDPMPAADADQWYAWSLFAAARAFHRPDLAQRALPLLQRLWEEEVLVSPNGPTLLPGPWARTAPRLRLNPSYFLPFAIRTFAEADKAHPWMSLLDAGYAQLASYPAGLPPDWVEDGKPAATFGYEAFRLIWSLAADGRWFGERRARQELRRYAPLWDSWKKEQRLPAFQGEEQPYIGLLAAVLPALSQVGLGGESELYLQLLQQREQVGAWGSEGDYYAANWVWFGVALWSGVARPPEKG